MRCNAIPTKTVIILGQSSLNTCVCMHGWMHVEAQHALKDDLVSQGGLELL